MRRPALLLLPLALVIVACGGADDAGDPPREVPTPTPPATSPDGDAAEGPAAEAVADLAADLGVSEGEIEVVTQEEVTWRDGSLGCPEADGMYTQALVDGYRIVLRAEGTEYHYHGAQGEPPFRCDDPAPDGTADET